MRKAHATANIQLALTQIKTNYISVTQRPKEIQKLPIPAANIEYVDVLVRREPGAPAPTELSRTLIIMRLVHLARSDRHVVTTIKLGPVISHRCIPSEPRLCGIPPGTGRHTHPNRLTVERVEGPLPPFPDTSWDYPASTGPSHGSPSGLGLGR